MRKEVVRWYYYHLHLLRITMTLTEFIGIAMLIVAVIAVIIDAMKK